jgi:hypothetical protein
VEAGFTPQEAGLCKDRRLRKCKNQGKFFHTVQLSMRLDTTTDSSSEIQ